MQPRRRYWRAVLFELLLVGMALLSQRPLLIAGAVAIGAFLVTVQYDFGLTVNRTEGTLTLTQTLTRRQAAVGETVRATLTAEQTAPTPNSVTVELQPPPGVRIPDIAEMTLSLAPARREAATTTPVELAVGGTHEFGRPVVTVADAHGWLTETASWGEPTTVLAQPRLAGTVHVGRGGEELAVGFGTHEGGQLGSGIEPAELREYESGEDAGRIDWKATARLNEPYVQEFESETDHRIALVFDHRASMGTGVGSQTKLVYVREMALAVVQQARESNDPVGLYTVGDSGLTAAHQPSATTRHYEQLRLLLGNLDVTDGDETDTPAGQTPRETPTEGTRLDGEESLFTKTVESFLQTSETYVERVQDTPLFRTIQSRVYGQQIDRAVLFTDDTNRSELLEATKLAQQGGTQVLVFLTPSVLFEAGLLSDLDEAYDRYLDFESFRRQLEQIDNVTAFEVGPRDRVATLVESRQERRSTA